MWSYFVVYGAGFLTGVWTFLLMVRFAMKLIGKRRKL